MKKILLLTDFSDNSLNAMNFGMELFKNQHCSFFILNVQKSSEYITKDILTSPANSSIYDGIAKEHKADLEILQNRYKKKYKKQRFTFNSILNFDSIQNAVNKNIDLHHIDLIIMGTNGANNVKEVLFGSNTLQIIRSISIPIMAIPKNVSFKSLKNVLFTAKYDTKLLNEEGANLLKYLLTIYQAKLIMLGKDDKVLKDSLKVTFPVINYEYYHLDEENDLSTALSTTIKLKNIDILVMKYQNESFFSRLLNNSELEKILYSTKVPLLILH